jgi:single-stranded-DNA-specific exonuclease
MTSSASAIRWQFATPDEEHIRHLITEYRLTRPVAMVLANRRIPPADLPGFLDPKLKDLTDPYLIPGMVEAAQRIWQAIHQGERILIHGDYDADGITSSVLLAWVLRENGAHVDTFLPHRLEDGYGLTIDSIDKAVTEQHRLLITVDCGITSCDATRQARAVGVDVIITDHHQPNHEIPQALAVINPKLHPHLAHLHGLAGVGVCFKLCHAIVKYGREHGLGGMHLDLREGLDLVTLGTVADIVPLLGENRCLVRHGIKILSAQRRPGIRALCESVRLNDQIAPEDITYRLAPRLNAAGRLGDPEVALRLLQSRSIVDAYPLAQQLDQYNRERQAHEEQAFASAKEQILQLALPERFSLLASGSHWHRGVIGIVASRISHEFHRPTIILTIDEHGDVHGSGRSVEGINLVDALHHCRHLLVRYGGHPMATGLALTQANLPAFADAFEAAIRLTCQDRHDFAPAIRLDGEAELAELDHAFFTELPQLMPFGHSNSPPLFCFRRLRPERVLPAGRDHSRGTLVDERGHRLAFIAFGRRPTALPRPPWRVAAIPELNAYRGQCTPQLQLVDLVAEPA